MASGIIIPQSRVFGIFGYSKSGPGFWGLGKASTEGAATAHNLSVAALTKAALSRSFFVSGLSTMGNGVDSSKLSFAFFTS